MDSLLAVLGLKKGAIIAGLAGGLVSSRFFKELDWGERIITILSGFLVAVYCGPWVAEHTSASEKMELGITFLIGVLGITILSAFVKAIPELVSSLVTGVRERFFK